MSSCGSAPCAGQWPACAKRPAAARHGVIRVEGSEAAEREHARQLLEVRHSATPKCLSWQHTSMPQPCPQPCPHPSLLGRATTHGVSQLDAMQGLRARQQQRPCQATHHHSQSFCSRLSPPVAKLDSPCCPLDALLCLHAGEAGVMCVYTTPPKQADPLVHCAGAPTQWPASLSQ